MARALRIQFPGAFYHITCRGIERRDIYDDDQDRRKFQDVLGESLQTYRVVLHAYGMMDNHFHLIVQTSKANCSEFMRHLNICYTGWFNWRHHRSGNLYQGRYKAFLVDADNYLLEVSRYVHLNPVRTRAMVTNDWRLRWRQARSYQWSSLAGYISEEHVKRFVSYDLVLSMAGGRTAYGAFMVDGLKRGIEDPFKHVKSGIILGDDGFVKDVKRHLSRGSPREQPSYREITTRALAPAVVMGLLARECGMSSGLLQQRYAQGVLRGMVAELLYRYCEITQAEIGQLLGGIGYMAVAQLRKRFKVRRDQNSEVGRRYRKIEGRLQKLMSNV